MVDCLELFESFDRDPPPLAAEDDILTYLDTGTELVLLSIIEFETGRQSVREYVAKITEKKHTKRKNFWGAQKLSHLETLFDVVNFLMR